VDLPRLLEQVDLGSSLLGSCQGQIQGLEDLCFLQIALLLDDPAELGNYLQSALHLRVVSLQPQLVSAQHNVDPDRIANAMQMLIVGSKQSPNLVVIGERDCRFGHAAYLAARTGIDRLSGHLGKFYSSPSARESIGEAMP
jgi:hypothetical protein